MTERPKPPPIPPLPSRKRQDVQEVIIGNEKPATLEALNEAITKLSEHLQQKVHLVVSRGPISPLTWLQSQQLQVEILLHSQLVAAAARWFERYRRKERSVEVGPWSDDEPTVPMRRHQKPHG
jgi:hypothetical protein